MTSPYAPPLAAGTAPSGRLRVDIWSDIACPWCYIGKRRFERALAQFPAREQVDVVWHSFELDPSAPARVEGRMTEVLARKFGRPAAQVAQMMAGVVQAAAGEGLTYRLDDVRLVNTRAAHGLIHLAATHDRQGDMKERLLRAYFTEGADLSDAGTLLTLALEVGLNREDVQAALQGGSQTPAVLRDEAHAQALGIGGVPFFLLGGRYGVSGAQPPEVFIGALSQAWADLSQRTPTPVQTSDGAVCEGEQCAVPGDSAEKSG